ncbi:flagellar biosynthesis protein FlhB [Oceanimonas baumannii]|uniref:Flagellar biosynthetic protein FlhB n=1 Tax=Oceanimonas baumannii TaxID=129578 RepID=A0A235CMY0_9GAMM|nr:flagellar biosynthesis protein FlhB [Oceanimonas baumannii]OYD25921.1 flagellar biosynthesis protein FlhB [Oceanimonas baumannii]TDW60062.1 flagellar biosynthetic protein FlhB [Oceanimonas baumannii]
MAESDGQERTEQPTEQRLRQAREKGQIPRSKELGTAAVLLSAAAALLMLGDTLGTAMSAVFAQSFQLERAAIFDPETMMPALASAIGGLMWPLLGLFAVVLVAALVGNSLLGGFNFSTQAMMPKWNRLSPVNGIKRMFGVQALVELLKSIAKVVFIATIAIWLLWGQFDNILRLSSETLNMAMKDALELLLWMGLGLCLALLPIVAIDVPFQVWNHTRQLKMTLQEVKDEYKNTEGKPEVKSRIRRLQQEMANRRMMAEVPTADVVVVNPSHYSVALRYDKDKPGSAPVVVAKGLDEVALKIREIAREYKVPVISSPALARAVYHSTKLDREIPDGLFVAVAQILAYVFQLNAWRKGQGNKPVPLKDDLPIPDEYRV